MQPNPKLLPFELALAIAKQEIKIPCLYGYVYRAEEPSPSIAEVQQIRYSPNTDYAALEKLGMGFCPAPDFTDLWQVMPPLLKYPQNPPEEAYMLNLMGLYGGGYRVAYYWEFTKPLIQYSDCTPVKAAGGLLLHCLEQQLITVQEINQIILNLGVHESQYRS